MTHFARTLLLCTALAMLGASPALAHSTTKSTSPASGSILPASPPEVVVTFNEAARMTSMVVIAPGQPERKLSFSPSGSATSFKVRDPALGIGRNEVQWKALSKDGHPISGSIIVVIKPGVTPSLPSASSEHDGH